MKQSLNQLSKGISGGASGKEISSGDIRAVGLILGSGRYGGEHGNPLSSILVWKNPMDRGAWQATQSIGSQKSHTQLKQLSTINCLNSLG